MTKGAFWRLTVRDDFSAGHALRHYEGKCERMHGHNFGVELTVQGQRLTRDTEMLLDFKRLKTGLKTVLDALDHRLLNETPPFDVINPSSENLARHIWRGMAELLARVRALLRRRPEGVVAEAQLCFGDFEIDCVRRTVSKAGMPLHLTQIEYRLLAYLAAHPGRVLTHRHLLAQVWGGQAVENHQYLRVYVGHLRQKIESNPAQPRHILTEIGVGYRFQL